MATGLLCPAPAELHVEHVTVDGVVITVVARACRPAVPCPACDQRASRVHGWYVRTLADLPWQGHRVRLLAHVRKWCCDTPDCVRRSFVERLPRTAAIYAHRTCRAAAGLELIGFALGGRAGAALAASLGLDGGRAAILARLRTAIAVPPPTPRVLGVDDWAGRRGRTYGTVLIDLERHAVVDLLPDREAATFATWLRARPGVAFVARDRGGAYAEGARLGAPDAIQVADRFHLVCNFTQALDRPVLRHHVAVRTAATACGTSATPPHAAGRQDASSERPTAPERLSAERRRRRLALYEQVVALHTARASILGVARQLGCAVKTVHAWVHAGAFPERRVRSVPQPRVIDPFAHYMRQRYDAGLDSARVLEQELRPLAFRGSYQAVGRYLRHLRHTRARDVAPSPASTAPPPPAFTAREAIWVLQRADADATPDERRFLAALIEHCPALARVHELAIAFRAMFRARDPNALRPWLVAARGSALAPFATSLTRGFDAVLAALVFPWSSGQVEGQVHRLKLVKHSMYGRARLDLLRAKMLHTA